MTCFRSYGSLNPPLKPRKGKVLIVVGVARISTEHQDAKSLEDQEAFYREWLGSHYEGTYEMTVIASRGSGERLDRDELSRLDVLIANGEVDLVLAEDLGRIARRIQATIICEACEDADVRLIAINDHVDTGREDWKQNSMYASMRHESYNQDTAKRIRRTQRSRFLKGGVLRLPLFCYIKPVGAKNDAELQKNPEMVPIVEGIVTRLETGWTFSAVADWLNEQSVPLGPGSRVKKWTGVQVRNIIFNPLLKGLRVMNRKMSVRVNKTGRRKSVNAPPEELLERPVPHLAFVEAGRYDSLIARMVTRGEQYSVPKRRGDDPRKGRPKKRTRFPGQMVTCGICGWPMVFGGHGRKTHLMCSGARRHACWNGTTFDADLACSKISGAVFDLIAQMPDFDPLIRQMMVEEAEVLSSGRNAQRIRLEHEASRTAREIENMLNAIRLTGNMSAILTDDLARLEIERNRIARELTDLDDAPQPELDLPSIDVIRAEARKTLEALSVSSYEFGLAMKQIITRFVVVPVRLCDGGNVELRAKITLSLAPFVSAGCRVPSVEQHLTNEISVNLFEPPQRAKFLQEVIALRSNGVTERTVAEKLGLTITATQKASSLHRQMQALGLTDPYVQVTEPPTDLKKMRRHLHKRYRFEPRPDEAA